MKEVRTILFSVDEVQAALAEHCRRRGKPLPVGVVREFAFKADPISASFVLVNDHGVSASFAFSQVEVAAAVIGFCLHRKVPLPAKADKQIQVMGSSLMLVVTTAPTHFADTPKPGERLAVVAGTLSVVRH